MFIERDAEIVELNPLVLSKDRLFVKHAKIKIDENSTWRQPELALQRDYS